MKNALVITILVCLGIVAVSGQAIQNHRADTRQTSAVTEQRPVGAFSELELDGRFDVVVHAQAAQNALELSGRRQELDDIETFVRGDTLVVRSKPRHGFYFSFGRDHRDETRLTISAAAIKRLSMSGSGDVTVDQLSGDKLALEVNGPGNLHASGAVGELSVSASGSGDADLRHLSSASLKLDMSGPGDVLVSDVSKELSISVSGSGDLAADKLQVGRLVAQLSGPGNVALSGSARELRADVSGSGDLDACKLAVQEVRARQDGPGTACVSASSTPR